MSSAPASYQSNDYMYVLYFTDAHGWSENTTLPPGEKPEITKQGIKKGIGILAAQILWSAPLEHERVGVTQAPSGRWPFTATYYLDAAVLPYDVAIAYAGFSSEQEHQFEKRTSEVIRYNVDFAGGSPNARPEDLLYAHISVGEEYKPEGRNANLLKHMVRTATGLFAPLSANDAVLVQEAPANPRSKWTRQELFARDGLSVLSPQ